MMPYAHNGLVQQGSIVDGVEITNEQFVEAVEGMCAGLMVSIEGGFKLIEVPDLAPLTPAEPTTGDMAVAALSKRDYLLSIAAIRIAPLQDAIDLGSASTIEVSRLAMWKQYRVDLNRIEQQVGFPSNIEWPAEIS